MAPGKAYIHKMEASELAALKTESPQIVIYWKARPTDSHDSFVFAKYPSKVLTAFSDAPELQNPKYATFVGWQKEGIVKPVLQWMLDCCGGEGLKTVKDIEINTAGLVSANGEGGFGRYFKTAYLFDFAQEYKIRYLEDKLKRELEFQTKGKYPIRFEEIYDMANYFYQPLRDSTAMDLMIDSIAKGFARDSMRMKHRYEEELDIWATTKKCDCVDQGLDFCNHDDLPEKVAKRVTYFLDPRHEVELNEEFGKSKVAEEVPGDGPCGKWSAGKDWNAREGFNQIEGDWDDSGHADGHDKENQAPGSCAEDVNEEDDAAADQWTGAVASGGSW